MKLFTQNLRWLIMSLLLVVGGSAWAEDAYYTLDTTGSLQGSNNSYAGNCDIESGGITWNVTGNTKINPWRLGGKSITNEDRAAYTKTAMGSAISKVELTVGSATATVNSVKIVVASDANFSNIIEELTTSFKASSTITFEPSNSTSWETGAYYKFIFNVTCGSSNQYVQFSKVAFYAAEEPSDTRIATTTTFSGDASYDVSLGSAFTAPTATLTPTTAGTLKYESSNTGVATVNANSGAVSILAAGTTTITAKFEGSTTYKPSSASYTINVSAPAQTYTSIQQLQENVTSTAIDINFQMSDIYVTAVKNSNAWITDGTYGALIYTNNHGLTAGQKINGTLNNAKLVLYRGQTEITGFNTNGLTITEDPLAPQVKTIDQLSGANQSLLVTLENVTYDGSVLSDGTNTITPYTTFISDLGLESGKTYNITGIVILYNTTLEIAPRTADDIVEVDGTIDTRTETYIRFTQGDDGLNYPSGSDFSITVGDNFISPEAWVTLPTGVYLTKSAVAPYLSFSGDNDAVATVNPSTGVLTFVDGATGTIKVTATFVGNDDYKPSEGFYTLNVKPEEVTPTGTGDEITYDFVGVTGTTYTEWSGKEGASGAVYAGKTAGGNTAVQMRTNGSDCGIVTTTSGGKVTMVTVDWNSNTSSSRTLDIYGSDEPYTSAADLYDSSKQGTKLGSICIDDATQLVITGDYAYIGIRSNNGALWCDKITIYWEETTDTRIATSVTLDPATTSYNVVLGETFTAPSATLNPAEAGTLTYTSSDGTVATVAADGTVEILDAGTTTITAKFAGNDYYKPSQATYTIEVTAPAMVYTTIQQLQENATSTAADITMQMTDIYVTAVRGNQAWISDGTYGALIYTSGHGLSAGEKLNGTITGKLVTYHGATEITNFDGSALTKTSETLAPVENMSISAVTIINQSMPITLTDLTYNATDGTFVDDENVAIAFYDQFQTGVTLVDGHIYDVTGLIVYYDKLQLAPLTAESVVDQTPAATVEAPTFDPAGGTYDADQNVAITCTTEGATIYYTIDGTEPTSGSTQYTGPVAITSTTTLKAIAYVGTDYSEVTTATYTINKVEAPYAKEINSDYFVKVTSLDQLENGDAVIILNEDADVAMGSTQSGNNRPAKPETIIPWSASEFYVVNTAESTQKFTLVKDGDNYYFYANHGEAKGYLYAASSTGNQLKTKAQADDNAKAAIVLDNGDATITFQGTNTRNILRFNAGNNLFSCYAANSTIKNPVQIYVEVERPTEPKTVTLTEATDCYKTIVAPYNLDLSASSLKAYIVTVNAEQTDADLVAVTKVPAGTPIVLHSNAAGTYELTKAAAETDLDDVSDNELKVSKGDVEGDFDGTTATIYVLNMVNSQIGFYPLNSGKTLAAGKCYLEFETASGAKFIGFTLDDATGINDIASEKMIEGTVYNLSGQRVNNPTKGIYIVNGKKVYVK